MLSSNIAVAHRSEKPYRQRETRRRRLRRQRPLKREHQSRSDDPLDDYRFDDVTLALVDASAALPQLDEPELSDMQRTVCQWC